MEKFALKLTAAVVLEGEIKTAGTIVQVDQATAQNLLHRGRAVVATEADEPKDEAATVGEVQKPATAEPAAEVATEAAPAKAPKTPKAKAPK